MDEMLAETYVRKARDYVRADSDCAPLPGSAEQMTFALLSVARERDLLRERLARIVKQYDAEFFMRTADMHPVQCDCLRCAVDAART